MSRHRDHWYDENPPRFTKDQRPGTTVLFGGLTRAHDILMEAALRGLGYNAKALDCPDKESLRYGKEFGNRGQCNPAHFTTGNLLKYLMSLKAKGMTTEEIVRSHVFVNASACGPCRFGTYITEYRKVLRDAGFEGFRALTFQQQGGFWQTMEKDAGFEFNPRLFITLLKVLVLGDVVNAVGYGIRPYEIVKGQTDAVLDACKDILYWALERRTSLLFALLKCRRRLSQIEVNRLQAKPKVSLIGEFWAITTEGDGNYQLQKFLESEGAEVDTQTISSWMLYNIWQHIYDTKRRCLLPQEDGGKHGLRGKNAQKKLILLKWADWALRFAVWLYGRTIGLERLALPDMHEMAVLAHPYYDNHLRGGEGHMEVGKVIQSVQEKKAHMILSVKPFGCLPSSGVSDGVRAWIQELYPDAIFCAIETTGDAAANAYGRVQMDLFRAKQVAQEEFQKLHQKVGRPLNEIREQIENSRKGKALYYPKHSVAGTGANQLAELIPNKELR